MTPNRPRLPKHVLFAEDRLSNAAPAPDLAALETAKARQDACHRKLDAFIAAALAELGGDDRAA